jgi:hypothetical protein
VETRYSFSKRCFNNELLAYLRLRPLQGHQVPKFIGHWTTSFPDRELSGDRTCDVIILEVLEACRLDKFPITEIGVKQRQNIRTQILDIATYVHSKNILFPQLSLSNFMILKNHHTPRMVGFSSTFDPQIYSLTDDKKNLHKKFALQRLQFELDDFGYV